MFSFMRSKKGFTLVELMIVVVIMAILVAVAVPIFSAVTKNARTKTCVANMREIVAQITTYSMSTNKTYSGVIEYTSNGEEAGTINSTVDEVDSDTFKILFQVVPYCPASGSYKIECESTAEGRTGSTRVTITCTGNTDNVVHTYSNN